MKVEINAIITELHKELKMRKKVWPKVTGFEDRFVSMEQQKRYDVLRQLLDVLEYCPVKEWNWLQERAESAKNIVQGTLALDDDL